MAKRIAYLLLLVLLMSPTTFVWADQSAPGSDGTGNPPVTSPEPPSDTPPISQIPEAPIIPNFADITSQVPIVPSAPTLDVPKSPPSGPTGGFVGGLSDPKPESSMSTLDLAAAAKVTKETDKDGQVATKVAVDANKLEQAFSEKIQIVVVEITGIDPIAKVDLPTNALLQAATKQPNALVQIKVNGASYHLPVSVFKNLPKDTVVNVTITKLSETKSVDMNAKIEQQGSKPLLDKPVDFTVSINGEEVTDFHGAYVDRTVSLKPLTDASKATAVWIDANNKMNFIPSVILTNNDSVEVTIHSPHNSIYTIIQSNKSFADMQGHWAKSDVEFLANKLIVDGITDKNFGPDNNITRAEFAALLVRSMGLVEVKPENSFKDVKAADWYAGAVGAAQKAGFIAGYEDGSFKPNGMITREQMVSMISKAMKAVRKDIKANQSVLIKFNDQSLISGWAKDAVSESLSIGVIQGTTDTTFSAQDQATRAQAVSVLKRALQYLQFVN